MKKFLMVATVPSMIGQFNMNNIQILIDMGYEVHVACNFNDRSIWTEEQVNLFKKQLLQLGVKRIQIEFSRTPYNISKLFKAYRKLRKIIKKQKYEGLHCHTPIAGVIARFAAFEMKTKIIYTAHGFHFYEDAPFKNWLIYYPIEKICSYMTDILITINKEDYKRAKKEFNARKTIYIPGVGVDLNKFKRHEENHIREELGIPKDAILLLSVGELNKNKNHDTIIKALTKIPLAKKRNIFYIIAGTGRLENEHQKLINRLGLSSQILLLGFRKDIVELYNASDIYILPSIREGLNVSLMEAMACELPCIVSDIRGNRDLIIDGKGGYLIHSNKIEEWVKIINNNLEKLLYGDMGVFNRKRIELFSEKRVLSLMKKCYENF